MKRWDEEAVTQPLLPLPLPWLHTNRCFPAAREGLPECIVGIGFAPKQIID
jgi:hypothetical protein